MHFKFLFLLLISLLHNSYTFTGDMLSILKHVEVDLSNTDILFWRRASDPVLAHDPFSTLMWILFCLPYPFLSCEESLLSLVHAFYIVAITQVCHLAFNLLNFF